MISLSKRNISFYGNIQKGKSGRNCETYSKSFEHWRWRIFWKPDRKCCKKIPEGKWAPIKTLEEAAELTEAIKDQLKCLNDPLVDDDVYVVLRNHSLEEFCDVYQTLVNIAYAFGFTQSEIEYAYMNVVHNNNKRGRYHSDEYSENWLD